MDYFKYKTYERDTVTLLRAYAANQMAFLRRMYPDQPIETIQTFVTAEINRSLLRPKLTMVNYPSYGNAELATVDLLTYSETMRKNILTPAGVIYMPPSVKESFLKAKINRNTTARKIEKKKMLKAASLGDLVTEQRSNYLQSSIKIETNAIPGAFGSAHNCLYDKPGYNAVTSIARHCIMAGYAHVEKMLEGNLYFPTLDHCINYCLQLVRLCPKDVLTVVNDFGLYVPSVDDVAAYLLTSLKLYLRLTPQLKQTLNQLLCGLSAAERTFIYYAYCLKTLLMKNSEVFRPFLAEFFRTDVTVDPTVEPTTIFQFNSDLLAMLSVLNADIIERKSVGDAVTQCPDGVRHLIAIGHHMQRQLDSIGRLIATFLRIDGDVADAMSHPHMIRKAVIISDTDSVIFSTQHWVEWYTGKISFAREAYAINSFVVFLVTMTLEQVFARLSANFGAEGEDIFGISMKNEFLYPLMLRTPLPKQYAGEVSVQEGFVLPKPKYDIKGLSFRSSTMSSETTKAGQDFVKWIFAGVTRDGSIKAADCLERVLEHELRVIKSLEAGERTFLTTVPIRNVDDYKDADSSRYYYWKLWDEVYRPNFGEFIIPNKGYEIPVMGNGKVIKDPRYLERVRGFDPALYERLQTFMEKNPRAITRLVVPMTLKRIPAILRPLIDIRGIVFTNLTPFLVVMRSLGIGLSSSKEQTLLSDIYTLANGEPCSLASVGD